MLCDAVFKKRRTLASCTIWVLSSAVFDLVLYECRPGNIRILIFILFTKINLSDIIDLNFRNNNK